MTSTVLLLLAMLLFEVWACLHVRRRWNWHQDETEAGEFIALLRAPQMPPCQIWSRAGERRRPPDHLGLAALMDRLRYANAAGRASLGIKP